MSGHAYRDADLREDARLQWHSRRYYVRLSHLCSPNRMPFCSVSMCCSCDYRMLSSRAPNRRYLSRSDGAWMRTKRQGETYSDHVVVHHNNVSNVLPTGVQRAFHDVIEQLMLMHCSLVQFSHTFNVSYDTVSRIPTLVQVGLVVHINPLTDYNRN